MAAGSAALAALAPPVAARAQNAQDSTRAILGQVLPAADRFADRAGRPPVFRAYSTGTDGTETLEGYAFVTSDFPPEQLGFDGPIEVLVGLDLEGRLTGLRVLDYRESLRNSRGDFLSEAGFLDQFVGKRVADAFRVRRDVDGITGATISVDAMARGVRNAAREVARAYGAGSAAGSPSAPALHPATVSMDELAALSWAEMVDRGLVRRLTVLDEGRAAAELSLIVLRDDAVAEVVVGPVVIEEARRRAGDPAAGRRLVAVGLDGPLAGGLNLARLAAVQGNDTLRIETGDVVLFGPPDQGKMDGQANFLRVLLFDGALDPEAGLTWVLDLRPGLDAYSAEQPEAVPAVPPTPATPSVDRGWGRLLAALVVAVVLTLIVFRGGRRS